MQQAPNSGPAQVRRHLHASERERVHQHAPARLQLAHWYGVRPAGAHIHLPDGHQLVNAVRRGIHDI